MTSSITGDPLEGAAGDGTDLSGGGNIVVGGPTNTEESTFSHQTGADVWTVGIDDTDLAGARPFKIARGSDISADERLEISTTGNIRFNAYGAGVLQSDATGNITSGALVGVGDVTMALNNATDNAIIRGDGTNNKIVQTAYASGTPTFSDTGQLTMPFYGTAGNLLSVGAGGVIDSTAPAALQGAYNNGSQILIDNTNTAVKFRAGVTDANPVIEGRTIADAVTFSVTGAGDTNTAGLTASSLRSTNLTGTTNQDMITVDGTGVLSVGTTPPALVTTTFGTDEIMVRSDGTGRNIQTGYTAGREISSTDLGFVTVRNGINFAGATGSTNFIQLPTMDDTTRDDITQVPGLARTLIYNTDTNLLNFNNGTQWLELVSTPLNASVVITGGSQTLVVGQRSATFTATTVNFPVGTPAYTWTTNDTGAFISVISTGATSSTCEIEFSAVGNYTVSCRAVFLGTDETGTSGTNDNTVTAAPAVEGLFDTGLATVTSGTYNAATFGCVYSVRRTRAAYTGPCLQILKPGGTLTNIGFDSDGYVSRTQAEAASGTGTVYPVTIWYDQSGNTRNAVSVADRRPVLAFTNPIASIPQLVFTPAGVDPVYLLVNATTADLWLQDRLHEGTMLGVSETDTYTVNRTLFGNGEPADGGTYNIYTTGPTSWAMSTDDNGGGGHLTEINNNDLTSPTPWYITFGTDNDDYITGVNNVITVHTGGRNLPNNTTSDIAIGNGETANVADSWRGSIYELFITDFNWGTDRALFNARRQSHIVARGTYPDILAGPNAVNNLQAWYEPANLAATGNSWTCSAVGSPATVPTNSTLTVGAGNEAQTNKIINELNGEDVLRITGTQGNLSTTSFAYNSFRTITMFIVARTNNADNGDIFSTDPTSEAGVDFTYGIFNSTNHGVFHNGILTTSVNAASTGWAVFCTRCNDDFTANTCQRTLWVNGGTSDFQTVAARTGTQAEYQEIGIGGRSGFANIMDVAECAVYDRSLNLTEVNEVGNYLATKYGLAWTTAT